MRKSLERRIADPQLEQTTEDLHDLAFVAERKDEEPISFEEMSRRLKLNGFL